MKAIKHKPTGKWLYYSDSDGEYLMSDDPIPCDPPMTDDEIATDVEDVPAGKYKVKDIKIVTVHILTDTDLDTIRREAFEAARDVSDQYTLERGNYVLPPVYPTAQDYIDSLKKEESK